jgi:menaquinone-dependent protoporphyrinogen oxidase
MKPIGVLYATREGQTKRIAEHIAARFRSRGLETDVRNLANRFDIDLNAYSAVVLAASVHAGEHEPEMVKFVKEHRVRLESLPAAFLSVTLSEAGVERPTATEVERARFATDVRKVLDRFFEETGWHPNRVMPVAGALLYTKYNFFIRFVMKQIAKRAGAETDTSRDYEYTDWSALDHFVDTLCNEIHASSSAVDAV